MPKGITSKSEKISAYGKVTCFDYDERIPFSEFIDNRQKVAKERFVKLSAILSKI